ncbi:MAG: chromosome segregation protein SMC, partial [Clostridiales bacterium]
LRMVTLEGEIITPGGAMTGGSTSSQKGGILLRLRQIEELKEESAKLKLDLIAAEQKNKTLAADLESLRQNQVAMTAQKEQYAKDELLAVNALAQLKKEQERLKADISLEKFEQAEAQNILSQSKTEIAAIEIELDLLVKRLAQRQTQENSRKEEIERLEKELAACQQKRHDQEILTTQLKERLQAISEQKSASEQQLASYETQINEKIAEKEEKEQLIAQTSADLAINAEKSAQLKQEFFSSKQKIEILRASREDLRLIIEKNEEILREKQKLVQNWQEKKFQTELELNKYKNRLEVLERNLAQNYECTYEEGLLSKIEITDEAQARKDAAKLKSKINALGNINFAAIEEYDEVKNRLEFLEGQLADLTEAKASLDKVIKDMEQIMAKKFRETYVVVNQIFSEVFATMFGGGEARLQLSNPNDYLKTGVEIMVRPPGKKEQNLSLLSGGERAMTAIALLFALLNVRPSPFCVLDEIEAALDEVNVERFAKFIKEYTKKSQFIVISHRKGTMEAADVLYGVSMENDGVSKLVSVRLEDYA